MSAAPDRQGSRARKLAKRAVVGRAIAGSKLEHQLLPKRLALPVFASDQLSSVAYATEQMMLILVTAGAAALWAMVPLGAGVAVLLAIVIVSYRQTCRAYPRGGGSYIVAKENLGTIPGLVAAAAIQTSYVLTVAVSVTAGAIAVTSAVPGLAEYKVTLALAFIILITLANLRGAKEAGRLFALPTYGFVVMVLVTLATGVVRCIGGCPRAETESLELDPVAGIGLFLLLRAFSSGATALTGVEAIADGVQAFRRPQARNAAQTLALMGAMSIPMFLGITVLARALHVRVDEELAASSSVLSQIGETVFGRSWAFWLLQILTAGILVLAANTAYQDFPRLASILARDRFMPSQFRNRGDRLVFSNGVLSLAFLAGILVWFFQGELSRLIHLYVVGVFTAITLSQAGMVRRWLRERSSSWGRNLVINGVGVTATGTVLVIIAVTQFALGAWVVLAAIPFIVAFFLGVRRHYERVQARLLVSAVEAPPAADGTFVVLVRDVGLATSQTVAYLRALRPRTVIPLFVGDPTEFEEAAVEWTSLAPRLGKLEILRRDGMGLAASVRWFLRGLPRAPGAYVTVVVPETLGGRSLARLLPAHQTLWLKASLLFEPDLVVTNVPLLPEERAETALWAQRPVEPSRSVVLVPVSSVNGATLRAIAYADSLDAASTEALFFSTDPGDVDPLVEAWGEHRVPIPLALVEDPFRDLGIPLVAEVRRHTSRGDTVVTVVLPEFVVDRWWEQLLHNQTGLYIKRLLLFEPRVVVTSVPFHLGAAPAP
jgi:amino acid transporter